MSNIDFNTLTRLNNPNSRIDYDLRWSKKTGKFTVADAPYDRLNLNNNGLDVFNDANGNVVFMVVPNAQAPLYAGQEGKEKSNTFSASRLIRTLDLEKTTTFEMKEVEHEGNTYFTLEVIDVIEEDDSSDEEATTASAQEEEIPEEANSFSI